MLTCRNFQNAFIWGPLRKSYDVTFELVTFELSPQAGSFRVRSMRVMWFLNSLELITFIRLLLGSVTGSRPALATTTESKM